MKPRSVFTISPLAGIPLPSNAKNSTFDYLVKNQFGEKKIKSSINKGMERKDLLIRIYRISILNRALFTIAFPIFIWLILETFFK